MSYFPCTSEYRYQPTYLTLGGCLGDRISDDPYLTQSDADSWVKVVQMCTASRRQGQNSNLGNLLLESTFLSITKILWNKCFIFINDLGNVFYIKVDHFWRWPSFFVKFALRIKKLHRIKKRKKTWAPSFILINLSDWQWWHVFHSHRHPSPPHFISFLQEIAS